MRIIDISRDIFNTPVYPGDPEPYIDEIKRIKDGEHCNLTAFYSCLHTATHIDAPLHFLDGAADISSVPLELLIGECTVIEVPKGAITGEYVENKFPRGKERLLIKGNGNAAFIESGAAAAAAAGVKLIGIDRDAIGLKGQQEGTHKAFAYNNSVVLEGLNLEDVTPGVYFLVALPIKMSGTEASLTRAVLIADYLFWSGK